MIKDYSQESIDAWKAIGVSLNDDVRTVFQVYKGGAAERAGVTAGDSISTPRILFVNDKAEIYLYQNQDTRRRPYLSLYGYCDKRTGKIVRCFFTPI